MHSSCISGFNMFEQVTADQNSQIKARAHTKSQLNDIIMKIRGTTYWEEQDYCLASSVVLHAVV